MTQTQTLDIVRDPLTEFAISWILGHNQNPSCQEFTFVLFRLFGVTFFEILWTFVVITILWILFSELTFTDDANSK